MTVLPLWALVLGNQGYNWPEIVPVPQDTQVSAAFWVLLPMSFEQSSKSEFAFILGES
jgi:hypothetical protein